MEDVLTALAGASCFSKFDFTAGYNQLAIKEEDRGKTAFVGPTGTYEYNVAPFGLVDLPAQFNRILALIFRDCWTFLRSYFDDLIMFTETVEEHLGTIRRLLDLCRTHNIILSIEKTKLLQVKLTILGMRCRTTILRCRGGQSRLY
jgi:hypothetical protein